MKVFDEDFVATVSAINVIDNDRTFFWGEANRWVEDGKEILVIDMALMVTFVIVT
ncbi:hypothetical protein AGMMS49921_11730 [Endomicrobiia bacterium]|nr:hypothetical protein AGMMS49921_11730 [Endomicrobiia bacterium]